MLPFKRPPSRPQPPGLAPALSRPPAWPTPALPCQAVRRAPGRPPEQPKPMRAPRPAAGADETELPAREEELRINAVQESIPAVRGMEPPSHRLCWERAPDSTSSRVCGSLLPTWIHPPRGSRALAGDQPPGDSLPLQSLGDPLFRRTEIWCQTRVSPSRPTILGFPDPGPRTCPPPRRSHCSPALTARSPSSSCLLLDPNPSRRCRPRVPRPWLWLPPLYPQRGGLPVLEEAGPGSCCALQRDPW